jgi:NAD/NADP transhydrogenase beta subunit
MDIALVHLETAIELFLNNQNFICASTLAGAAEDILGKIVCRSGKTNAFKEL